MPLPERSTWTSLPRSKAEAKRTGARHFYTGRPCKRGHDSIRKMPSGNCVACERDAAYVKRQRYHHAYRKRVTRERRRAEDLRKRFTPPWLSAEDRAAIKAIYAARPKGMVVDHFVPFEHDDELVVGLHVPKNLSYVTAAQNVAKGGKLELTQKQAHELVDAGLAIWRRDVSADFRMVNWEPYRPR